MASKRYVALIFPNDGLYYLFDTKQKAACCFPLSASWASMTPLHLVAKELFVLHDLGKDAPMTPKTLPTVIATSPKYAKCNEFLKDGGRTFYTPVFDDKEMQFVADTFCTPFGFDYTKLWDNTTTTWQRLAHKFDNVPRQVFGCNSEKNAMVHQLTALCHYTLDQFQKMSTGFQATRDINDRLVVYVPNSTFDEVVIALRRGYVSERLAEEVIYCQLSEYSRIVNFTNNGHVFESVLHQFLASFPQKLNPKAMKQIRPGEPDINVPADFTTMWPAADRWEATQFGSDTKVRLQQGHYYYPRDTSFPVIDSFLTETTMTLLCFQLTISRDHPTTAAKVELWLKKLEELFEYSTEKYLHGQISFVPSLEHDVVSVNFPADDVTLKFDLKIHFVYITPQTAFQYQPLAGPRNNEVYLKFWGRVLQYRSGLPRVDA